MPELSVPGADEILLVFMLGFFGAVAALMLAAWAKILTKAGYSGRWIWLPGIQALIQGYVFFKVFSGGVFSVSSAGSLGALSVLSAFISLAEIVLFLIFAFGTWPVQRELETVTRQHRASRREMLLAPGLRAMRPTPPAAEAPEGTPATVTTVLEPPALPSTVYCSWCGSARALDSHAMHYCGPRSRPAAYCSACGTALDGSPACRSCGTPSSSLSPK